MSIDPKKGIKAREKSKTPQEVIECLAKLRLKTDEEAANKVKNILKQLEELKKQNL